MMTEALAFQLPALGVQNFVRPSMKNRDPLRAVLELCGIEPSLTPPRSPTPHLSHRASPSQSVSEALTARWQVAMPPDTHCPGGQQGGQQSHEPVQPVQHARHHTVATGALGALCSYLVASLSLCSWRALQLARSPLPAQICV